MRGRLTRNTFISPLKPPLENRNPFAKDRYGRFPSQQSANLPPNSPALQFRSISIAIVDGRVSLGPRICTFPTRTMRLDDSKRLL